MSLSTLRKCIICGGVGLVLCILGTVICLVVPSVVRSKIQEILPLKENTESWDRWLNLPVPIQFRVYLFQVNNPDEVLQGAMPNVTEVGPYVYKEKRIKQILSINETEGTVTYDHKMLFEFDQEASGHLTDDDEIMLLNIPAALVAMMVSNLRSINPVIQLFDTAITKMFPTSESNPLFVKVKVKDYLFNGLPLLCNQTAALENLDARILCEAIRIIHPKALRLNDFGPRAHSFAIFRYKNNTSDGIYKINTGIHDITRIGQIHQWERLNKLPFWKGPCNRLRGTDATIFRPYLEEDNVNELEVFNTDACRTLELTYIGDSEYKKVKGRRYVAGEDVFADALKNSDNYCYSIRSIKGITHYGGCLKSGIQDISPCQAVPVFVSGPHFYNADPVYQGKIIGLEPDSAKHQIFLDLEPNTGYPLRAASRAQLNAKLKSFPEVTILKNLPSVLTPVLWIEERVELTDELIDIINSQLLNILTAVNVLQWVLIAFGSILFAVSSAFYFYKKTAKN